jgi:hypothetical protein
MGAWKKTMPERRQMAKAIHVRSLFGLGLPFSPVREIDDGQSQERRDTENNPDNIRKTNFKVRIHFTDNQNALQ